jgi:hypothetical protein
VLGITVHHSKQCIKVRFQLGLCYLLKFVVICVDLLRFDSIWTIFGVIWVVIGDLLKFGGPN